MDYSLYYSRPTLVLSAGPDRVVRDEPTVEPASLPGPAGFAPAPKHRKPGPAATYPAYVGHVPRHRAETAHDDALSRRHALAQEIMSVNPA